MHIIIPKSVFYLWHNTHGCNTLPQATHTRFNREHSQTGFTLVEILIALVVFSIGLMGLAGLQITSLKANSNAYLTTIATMQSNDIMDRMRANMNAVNNGDYNVPNSNGTDNNNCFGLNAQSTIDISLSCTASQMAAYDIFEWKNSVANQLPNGSSILCIDSTPNDLNALPGSPQCDNIGSDIYTIKMWWQERKQDNNLSSIVISFKP